MLLHLKNTAEKARKKAEKALTSGLCRHGKMNVGNTTKKFRKKIKKVVDTDIAQWYYQKAPRKKTQVEICGKLFEN